MPLLGGGAAAGAILLARRLGRRPVAAALLLWVPCSAGRRAVSAVLAYVEPTWLDLCRTATPTPTGWCNWRTGWMAR